MIAIVSLLVVIVLSLLVVRVASVALMMTGISAPLARFQARSAFTGAGFTTTESEKVVQHPVRRRIILMLMLLGNAGIVTAVSSLMLSFISVRQQEGLSGSLTFRFAVLFGGLGILWIAASSAWLDRHLSRIIAAALKRWTDLEIRDYAGLLHLSGGYAVAELLVEPGDWLADRALTELRLSAEGVLVLGVERQDNSYIGAPRGETTVHPGDTLLLYGPGKLLDDLDQRQKGRDGNWNHFRAVKDQIRTESEQEAMER